ncbi:MAG: hypothetical protein E6I02_03610 [Chloroflexi bacterium]|nr:MAG: hypothetical protein E6I02_03610 [Chloroflexota bacterium]
MDAPDTIARHSTRKRLTDEQILLIAIALVKASEEDGPNFVYEVAAVFHALKQDEDSRTRERLD